MDEVFNTSDRSCEGLLYCWPLQTETSQAEVLKPLFYMTKSLLKRKLLLTLGYKVIVLTTGVACNLRDNKLLHFQGASILGFIKKLQNEQTDILCRVIDIENIVKRLELLQVFQEIWNDDHRHVLVAYRGKTRYIPILSPLKPKLTEFSLLGRLTQFQLKLPEIPYITDLEFAPIYQGRLPSRYIEVEVKSLSLSLPDLCKISKHTKDLVNVHTFDWAGEVIHVHSEVTKWQVGDNVCGVHMFKGFLSSHLQLHEKDVIKIPNSMTFHEACTLPTPLTIAHHCLIELANVKAVDTVLINNATSEIGLAAIEICKHIGSSVIAVAATEQQENFLRMYEGLENIFNSRANEYTELIYKVTNGRGVSVLLNSSPEEGFNQAILKVCAHGVRVVDMSKTSISVPEMFKNLPPDTKYTTVDGKMFDFHFCVSKLKKLKYFESVTPIPYVRYNAIDICEVFRTLQEENYTKKVVFTMPEIRYLNGRRNIFTPMFSNNGTYIITGGLGGIGIEVCKWMLGMGAKFIVLAGRNAPDLKVKQSVTQLNNDNCAKIVTVQLDVSSLEDCNEIFKTIIPGMGYPMIRGVMHAAGILHDSLIENHSWDSFSCVFAAKIDGTWNLHQLTKNNTRLEYFVLFSSFCSTFGFPGQSNHAAGNSYEDAIARYRHSVGLPATSINWGQWGETGIATEVEIPGFQSMSTLQAIRGLEYALQSNRIETGIYNVRALSKIKKVVSFASSQFDECVWKDAVDTDCTSKSVSLKHKEFWEDYEMLNHLEEKLTFLKQKVRYIVRHLLKLEASDSLNDTDLFQEVGVDSLMFIDLQNSLQTLVGENINIKSQVLRDHDTVEKLSEVFLCLLEGFNLPLGGESHISVEHLMQMIKEDSKISDSIMAHSNQKTTKVSEISTVLITGTTGTLGPYILKELCKCNHVSAVICLIRSKEMKTAEQRLVSILKQKELLSEVDMTKIRCFIGDIALHKFGIDDDIWEQLCNDVDAVFHCAAKVDHVEMYTSTCTNRNSIKAVNVDGLKHILEFCCSGKKLKRLYHTSSIVSVATLNDSGQFSENWPQHQDFDGITTLGYPVSKFIGDLIMKEAVTKRGIPGKVFRFPFMSGELKTGRFKLEKNHAMLRFLFNMKHGVMENADFPFPVCPVDVCAQISLSIFLNPDAPDDVFNITNCNVDSELDFKSVAIRFGCDLHLLETDEYTRKLRELATGISHFDLFRVLYKNGDNIMSFRFKNPAFIKWKSGCDRNNFFSSMKTTKFMPKSLKSTIGRTRSMEYIYNDLVFAKRNGWFEKLEL